MAALEEQHLLADRALGYVELYGAYTETEARYRVDRLLALWDRMDADDRQAFCLDPAAIDWERYVRDIHLPSVIEHARVRTTPGKSTKPHRADRARKAILSPDRHLAAFDLENTLIASNVVDSYAWLASRHLAPAERAAFVADLVAEAPSLLLLDRRDRGDFLRSFYRRYEGAPVDRLRDDGWELFHHLLLAKSFPDGFARVRKHRALGHRTVLITGALDLVVEPLRPLFDTIVCARLGEADGNFTGRLAELPPIGEARALVLAEYAEAEGLPLEESMAYADSASDLPMLEAVGFPVAVNPEAKLASIARRRGWHVEHWHKAEGGSQSVLPLGPVDRRGSLGRGRTSAAALTGAIGSTPDRGRGQGRGRGHDDEGTGLRTESPPFRRLEGGLPAGLGSRCRHRSPATPGRGSPGPARRRLVPSHPPALGHLRFRPGHAGRPQLPLLRGRGQLPVRPRTRGGRRPRYRGPGPRRPRAGPGHPGGDRAGAGLRSPTHPTGVPLLFVGPHRPVRERGLRRPRTRPPDRVLRRHRWGLVDRPAVRPQLPDPRRPRVVHRRGRSRDRAHRLCRPRRAVGRGGRRGRGGGGGCGDTGTGLYGRPLRTGPAHHRLYGNGRGQARPPAPAGRGPGGRHRGHPRSAGPGRTAPVGVAGPGRTADRRRRCGLRLRGLLGVDHPGPGHGPTPRPGGAGGHAGQGVGGPGPVVAPRADPGRGLRLRHRAAPRGPRPPPHLRPGHRPRVLGPAGIPGLGGLPPRALRGGHRPRRCGRSPWRGQGGLRSLRNPKGSTR